jgi:hypothetical protein
MAVFQSVKANQKYHEQDGVNGKNQPVSTPREGGYNVGIIESQPNVPEARGLRQHQKNGKYVPYQALIQFFVFILVQSHKKHFLISYLIGDA